MSTKLLEIQNLYKTFNSVYVYVLNNVGFSLKKGNILAVVGESGSGKTTLIRLIAGLETIDEGKIVINSNIVSSNSVFIEPQQRNIGMVFQDYALFPHFTIYKNIAYGLSKHENKVERVGEVLKLVGLSGMEKRYPHELSGGQQQRIALARALAPKPALLILDEPFSNLDVVMRNQLRKDILKILKKTITTAIFVTHDIKDALEVSDEIIVLKNGIVLQQGKTIEIFNSPESSYVKLLFDNI